MRRLMNLAPIVAWIALPAIAADWPCWRGPDGLGVSSERHLPIHWSKQTNIVWVTGLPGKGASSPIVVGSRVYLTSQTADNGLHVLAIDRKSGKMLWDREVGRGKRHANRLHNMATPTPVSDGDCIWVVFGTGDVACLDRDGKIGWQRNFMEEYGECKTGHGYGSSPMLAGGRLFVTLMHQGPSYLLALDARAGTNVWKHERTFELKDEAQDSYSSPIVLRAEGRTQVVLAGAESINAYDSATGEQIWIHGGLKVPHHFGRTISGPAAGDGIIVAVASGFQNQGFTIGLKTGATGTIPESARVWTCKKYSPDCPTPVIYRGKAYLIRDEGIASCLDVKTGEPFWQERLFDANVKVSPVAGDGKIYFLSNQGNCAVVSSSKKLELLANNELNEPTLSTPCLSDGHLFLRTEEHVYCIGD